MGITISGENNNDRILASDGVLDSISGINAVGVVTATSFTGDLTGDVTGNLTGNVTGNVTGNINNTTLLLQTGGTERVRIASNGSVTVGKTSNAGKALEVYQNADAAIRIQNSTTGTGSNDGILIEANGSDALIYNYESGNLKFGTANTERLRINSSGNARLGGTSDTADQGYRLTLQGSSNATYLQFFDNGTGTTHGSDGSLVGLINQDLFVWNREVKDILFGTSNNEKLRIASDGTLTLKNNSGMMIDLQSSAANGSVWMEFSDTDGTRKGYIGYGSGSNNTMYIVQQKANNMEFYSNNSTRFLIQSNGNKIVQNGRLNILSTFIDFSGSISTPQTAAAIFRPADNTLAFSTANNERLRIASNGQVMIGTTTAGAHSSNLTIGGTSSGSGRITIRGANNAGGYISFQDTTGSTFDGQIEYNHVLDAFVFYLGSERLRIEANGSLTSSASNNGQIIHSFRNTDTTSGSSAHTVEHWFRFNRSGGGMNASGARIICGKEREWIGGASNQDAYLSFHVTENETSNERLRIASNGQVGMSKPNTYTDPARLYLRYSYDSSAGYAAGLVIDSRPDVLTTKHIRFFYALHGSGGNSELGSVTSSNAGSVSYNTSSDYRRKQNDVEITDGIAKVKNLRPIRFNWIEQPEITEEGFFAHEAQEVVPNSVFGAKDAVDKDGKPDYQVMDHSKLVPLLTASIKDLIAKVETLETKVAALEGS